MKRLRVLMIWSNVIFRIVMKRIFGFMIFLFALMYICACSPRTLFVVDSDAEISYDHNNRVFRITWLWESRHQGSEFKKVVNTSDSVESVKPVD